MNIVDQLKESGIVAVIRGATKETIVPIGEALSRGGVKALEITLETPNALRVIEHATTTLGDKAIVGAGTVLDPETASPAIMAGSQFVFSPTVNVDTIKITKRYGVLSIPGALTPTEILTAYEHGADLIKVFPASAFGPRYLKDVHGPLPHIPLMPTGGLDLDNVGEYIKAGAVAAGIGSSLVNTKKAMDDAYFAELEHKAAQFVQAVQEARV
ncbi:bifunctional 4-hydroxy-2-oxoglutarate aldolase/2-dehydro-3-deoxy-phosphogluconate aldolase [Halalkalibacterium ligniniphilum]|uniref:bifunctional 4-hydroxy-2-oxoglutarate aldolase/2-dehydro-3-deoxy-phosphogluconate aldolase n=1 Tax=Halalkalibacterium ligniniphilum TaxID=1134413 RepID=UPI000349CD9E|nr:bifunctional 4-hydroxy-2-oxoglutarate aldolase/2-dehydro-3-deoxy-phosphogluconate aldolase [Halalkalibacterium ligniniphilum]